MEEGLLSVPESVYTVDDIISELSTIKELQILHINNSIEFLEVALVFFGFLMAVILGIFFINVVFK